MKVETWSDIPGFFDYERFYDFIADWIPESGRAVEVGVYMGRSLSYLAIKLKEYRKSVELTGVDYWDNAAVGNEPERSKTVALARSFGGDLYRTFLDNVARLSLDLRHIRANSTEAVKQFADQSLDFVFIDADHRFEAVSADICAWLPKVKRGGILAGHDYGQEYPGVADAVNQLLAGRFWTWGSVWICHVRA